MIAVPATGTNRRTGAGFIGEAEAYALLVRAGLNPPRHAVVGGPLPFTSGEPVVIKGLGEELAEGTELGESLGMSPPSTGGEHESLEPDVVGHGSAGQGSAGVGATSPGSPPADD